MVLSNKNMHLIHATSSKVEPWSNKQAKVQLVAILLDHQWETIIQLVYQMLNKNNNNHTNKIIVHLDLQTITLAAV